MALIDVHHLTKQFIVRTDWLGRPRTVLTAVHDVSLTIHSGETVGLVGESGCGKSTFARTVLGLYKKTSGTVLFKGKDVENPDTADAFHRQVQMIFQDPYASLDPRMTVEDIIGEPLRNYGICSSPSQLRQRVAQLLDEVDLTREAAQRYPHEFSGGQRQRIGVARAVASNPKLIIADEPVSALDLSVQAQVLNYMKKIQKDLGISYMFISHDLGVVYHMCDNLAIMHRGKFVEIGSRDDIYNHPQHIYTKRLLAAIPQVDVEHRDEHRAYRKQVEKEFTENQDKWYDKDGKVYDLRQISETHWVALPDAGEEK